MSTTALVQLLYAALAVVMAGLGLSLRFSDFQRLRGHASAVAVALILQMVVLPLIALAINAAFHLSGYVAVGMILLAATPGSITANLYSHLFGGDVPFNLALTGLNTFLCALTLPLLGSWALAYYVGAGQTLPILYDKAAQTIGIVIIPVLLGMLVATKAPAVAARLNKPLKILSAVLIVVFSIAGIVKEWATLSAGFAQIGGAILLFNGVCLLLGFVAASLLRLERSLRITMAFQACIHNAIQAIYIGIAVLNVTLAALPAAVYSITMNVFALGFGLAVLQLRRTRDRRIASARPGHSSEAAARI
ncbi:MAG: bile acid:sodium symporter [Caldimonas sp.]